MIERYQLKLHGQIVSVGVNLFKDVNCSVDRMFVSNKVISGETIFCSSLRVVILIRSNNSSLDFSI